MAIAHVCPACGTDLARCRPDADPHYGLPIVSCPGCGAASVRRRHPLSARTRAARRVGVVLGLLVLQLGAIALLASATIAALIGLPGLLIDNWHEPSFREARWILLAVFGVVAPVVTGAWLTAGLHHWPRTLAWIVWSALVMGIIGLFAARAGFRFGFWDQILAQLSYAAITLPIVMSIAVLGIPIGNGLVRLNAARRRSCWRSMRRRRRRHRATVGGMRGW